MSRKRLERKDDRVGGWEKGRCVRHKEPDISRSSNLYITSSKMQLLTILNAVVISRAPKPSNSGLGSTSTTRCSKHVQKSQATSKLHSLFSSANQLKVLSQVRAYCSLKTYSQKPTRGAEISFQKGKVLKSLGINVVNLTLKKPLHALLYAKQVLLLGLTRKPKQYRAYGRYFYV